MTAGDWPCPHSIHLPVQLTPEFQAWCQPAPPSLPGHRAHAPSPPVSQGKSQSAGRFPPSFPAHPAPTPFSLLLVTEQKPVGGPPVPRPPPGSGPPGGCHFSRVFISSASRPPSPFPPVPRRNNSFVTRLPQRHTPSCPEVRRRDGRGFRSRRLAASQSPGTRRWGLPVTSQPHALQLARRLPPLFQAS